MFDYCSLIKANCSFAAKQKEITYCGLATGTQVETRVDYLKNCPKDKLKKKRKQLCRIIMEKRKRKRKRKKVRRNESESTKRVSLYEKEREV